MKTVFGTIWKVAIVAVVVATSGCGGLSDIIGGASSGYDGLYRAALTRGTSTLSISVDTSGNALLVVSDDAASLPSFTGSGTVTTSSGTSTLAATMTGSDGSTATVTGTFSTTSTSVKEVTLDITGGLGASSLVAVAEDATSIYPGTWTGTQAYTYTTGSGTTATRYATVTYTIASDGQTVTGSGTTIDPNGDSATMSMSGTLDPSGIFKQTTKFTYTGSTTTYSVSYTGFLNASYTTSGSIVGSQSGTWYTGQTESDKLTLTQTSSAIASSKKKS